MSTPNTKNSTYEWNTIHPTTFIFYLRFCTRIDVKIPSAGEFCRNEFTSTMANGRMSISLKNRRMKESEKERKRKEKAKQRGKTNDRSEQTVQWRIHFGETSSVPKKLTDNNGRVSQLKFSPFIWKIVSILKQSILVPSQ